jgi:hypothetical protein
MTNELRKGNIIAVDGHLCYVTAILENGTIKAKSCTDPSKEIDALNSVVNPVVLTDDILLRCGLKQDKILFWARTISKLGEDFYFKIWDFKNGYYFILEDRMSRDSFKEIYHLHQLQNLFFMFSDRELDFNVSGLI